MGENCFEQCNLQLRFAMLKQSFSFLFPIVFILLAGCALRPPPYSGITFPATNQAEVTFQEKGVPTQCRAFAHLIVHTPTGVTGARIIQQITDFAKEKGADFILIGMSRKISGKGVRGFRFLSYGPKEDYLFSKGWLGWKFGFEDWEEGGSMIGFGFNSWSDTAANDYSMKIQTVLLRCEPGAPQKPK
jgi:hypothetical protein